MTCKSLNLHKCIGCGECLPSEVAHQSHEIQCQHAINYKVLFSCVTDLDEKWARLSFFFDDLKDQGYLEALEYRVERDRENRDAARPEPACDVEPLRQWRLVITLDTARNDSLPLVDMTLEEVIGHGAFYGSQWEQRFRTANNNALTVRIVPA